MPSLCLESEGSTQEHAGRFARISRVCVLAPTRTERSTVLCEPHANVGMGTEEDEEKRTRVRSHVGMHARSVDSAATCTCVSLQHSMHTIYAHLLLTEIHSKLRE
jgi:hypothetical protein